jgi:[glutamine synthetase] adenylyltransferase / [glutamine synthetase]-adenylyl-L-tyrosine phosphorylase
LVLSDRLPAEVRERVLRASGFRDPARAYANLRRLAGDDTRRTIFSQLVVLACEVIAALPSPDAALDRWRHEVDELPDAEAYFRRLLAAPMELERILNETAR